MSPEDARLDQLFSKLTYYELFFKHSLDLGLISLDNKLVAVNTACTAALGFSNPATMLQEIPDTEAWMSLVVHPDDLQTTIDIWSRIQDDNQVHAFSNRLLSQDTGDTIWVEWRVAIKDKHVICSGRVFLSVDSGTTGEDDV